MTAEELGGGEVHARTSGVADHLAEDDAEALQSCAASSTAAAEPGAALAAAAPDEPADDPEVILGVVPDSSRPPYDLRESSRRIVDGGELHEFKAHYGMTLVCGFARITATRSASSPTTASSSARAR